MKPSLRVAVSLAAGLALAANMVGAAAAGGPVDRAAQTMGILGASRPGAAAATTPLTYGGGPIQQASKVYISWWGPQWVSGFTTGGYSSTQAQAYVTGFFGNVGGSPWGGIDTQYCQGVAVGTINCGSGGVHVTNPLGQLAGTWNDTTALPKRITQSSIASAALRLMSHSGGYDANATYMVFTPTGHSMSGFRTSWCAWHSVTSSGGNNVAYAYMPYIPDAGGNCGMNFVNKTNDAFGNGYFDGFSIVGGHEYAEAQTDPWPTSGSVGWQDSGGAENGDKCAWNALSSNVTLGSNSYAVQPIWSNATGGCVLQ